MILREAFPAVLSSVVRADWMWLPWMIQLLVLLSKLPLRMYWVLFLLTWRSSTRTSAAASMRIWNSDSDWVE